MRKFDTGATRDNDEGKPEYATYLSPRVIEAYGAYMLRHQVQADGEKRAGDNWKKGIPVDAYMQSMYRHFVDVWTAWDEGKLSNPEAQEALCALMFNVQGMLHETLKRSDYYAATGLEYDTVARDFRDFQQSLEIEDDDDRAY